MKKIWLIAVIIVLLFIIGIMTGVYSYQKDNAKDSNLKAGAELAQEENEPIGIMKPIQESIETASKEIKISPNAIIIEQQYYQGCDHFIETQKEVPQNLVNQGKNELKKMYPNWTIEKLTSANIILYRENKGYCNQHYIVKANEGVLAIYILDENGKEKWKEDTEIQTMYLPQEDLEKLNIGIKAVGNEQLHSILEDFE